MSMVETLAFNYCLAVPGSGEVLSYTDTVGLTSTRYVPLHDYQGWTVGLVGPSNTLQTQGSYTPSGAPTATGASTPFPFLFGGAQFDPTGLYNDYSPTLVHSLAGGRSAPGSSSLGPAGETNSIPRISFRSLGGFSGSLALGLGDPEAAPGFFLSFFFGGDSSGGNYLLPPPPRPNSARRPIRS
jgi:hypothetical protein